MLQRQIVKLLTADKYEEVKNKRKLQTVISKSGRGCLQEVHAWSLTRGSIYSDLTGEILVFWKSGRSREVVARGGSTV